MSDWEVVDTQTVNDGDWEVESQETSQEPQGFWSKLPANMKAGLAGLGRNVGEMALSGVKGIEGPGQIGQQAMSQLPGPHPTMEGQQPYSQQGQQALNQLIPMDYSTQYGPENPTMMDSLIQGGITHALEIAGAAGLARAGLKALPHFTQKGAAKNLSNVERMAGGADIGIDPELIQQSRRFLPGTQATQEMLGSRGYQPAFSTQSQIGKHARDLSKSPLAAERLRAPEAHELKQLIVNDIGGQLRNQGYHEAADLLPKGLNDYRRHIQMKEKLEPLLKYLGIPTTALAALGLALKYGKKTASD